MKYKYLLLFVTILAIELAIATLEVPGWIRGYLGDVLVIPLLYLLLRLVTGFSVKQSVIIVLSIALCIELLQAIDLSRWIDLNSVLLKTILGNTFDWLDLGCYLLGVPVVLLIERLVTATEKK